MSRCILILVDAHIRSGRLRYRYIDVTPDSLDERTDGIVRCLSRIAGFGRARGWLYLDSSRVSYPESALARAESLGLDSVRVQQCADSMGQSDSRARERAAAQVLHVYGTPTFIVGELDRRGRLRGWPVIGLPNYDTLSMLIRDAEVRLARARRR